MFRLAGFACALALSALAGPALAEDPKVPFWSAIRAKEVNMRVGPGEAYRVNWVYHRPLLPMKVLRTMEGWWLVQDPEGARGWVLASLMTKKRGAIVIGNEPADMRHEPDSGAKLLWRVSPGISGRLGDCENSWCHFELEDKRGGWVRAESLWGSGEP